jgi:hypothetical protein
MSRRANTDEGREMHKLHSSNAGWLEVCLFEHPNGKGEVLI